MPYGVQLEIKALDVDFVNICRNFIKIDQSVLKCTHKHM